MEFIAVRLDALVAQFGGEAFSIAHEGPQRVDSASLSKITLSGFGTLQNGQRNQLGFLANPKYKSQLAKTSIGVVLVRQDHLEELSNQILQQDIGKGLEGNSIAQVGRSARPMLWAVKDPYILFATIQQWWVAQSEYVPPAGIHPKAHVDETAEVDPSAYIGPMAVVGAHSKVSAHTRIEAGVVLGRHVVIGANTRIFANVSVYDECEIGDRCIIHSGVVIGADGFGFAPQQGTWVKIPQVGRVLIGDDVEIGANTTIDRGALEDTVIGSGVKLDNLIMIAHNVQIGDHTAFAGKVGVAGSTTIGARCTVGGAASILGHLNIPDGTHISACTTIMSSIKEPGAYTGIYPVESHKDWEKTAATLRQLVKLRGELRELQKNDTSRKQT